MTPSSLGPVRLAFVGALESQAPDASAQPVVLVVPGAEVLCRWLELPGVQAQAAGAAGYILEDQLATPRERLHVAVGMPEADGLRLAVAVDKDRMQAWMDTAKAAGLTPAAVVPDCLLPLEPEGDEAAALLIDGVYAVRGRRLALSCEPELAPLILGERPYRTIADPAEVRAMLAVGAASPVIDLQQGAFAARADRTKSRIGLASVLAGLAALSILALPAARAVRNELAAQDAMTEVSALAGPAAEGDNPDPLERLRTRAAQARAARDFPTAAASVFAAMERVDGMELQSLIYDPGGVFRASVAHSNYTDIELFKSGLGASGLTVEESSAVPEGDRIVSDLIVRPSR